MNWISIKDELPGNEERVLVYHSDGFEVLTYHRKGDALQDEMPPKERVELAKTKPDGADRLLTAMFACRERPAPEDGFYFYAVDKSGYCVWKKHADVITHWAELVAPK